MSTPSAISNPSDDRHIRDPFSTEILTHIRAMRAYAIALTGAVSRADDLVQDALINAFRARGQFTPDTNMRAWLFRIVRNRFLNVVARSRRMVEDPEGALAGRLTSPPEQEANLHYGELLAALQSLKPEHRDVLALLASGASYDEIAAISGLPVGTVKSRIHRGRLELLELLDQDGAHVSRRIPVSASRATA